MMGLSRRTAVLIAAVAAIALGALGRATWLTARAPDITGAMQTIEVPGQDAAAGLLPLALVAGAAALATSLTGRWIRWITGAVLIATGLGAIAIVLGVVTAPGDAASAAVAEATGIRGTVVIADLALWPWIALLPALVLVLTGAAILLLGGRWSVTSRYARPRRAATSDPADDPAAAWDALSRGEDPTLEDPRDGEPTAR